MRASIAGIMFLLILLFIQFMKINDLKSQRTILRGMFIGWTSVFVVLIVVKLSSIYFILLTGLSSLVILLTLFSLIDQIKEEKNTLTDKEIYLLQKLAKKTGFKESTHGPFFRKGKVGGWKNELNDEIGAKGPNGSSFIILESLLTSVITVGSKK